MHQKHILGVKQSHVRAFVSLQYQRQTALPIDSCCYPETLAFSRTTWPRDTCCHPGITQRPLLPPGYYPETLAGTQPLPRDPCCHPGLPRDPWCHLGITQRPLLPARHYPETLELPRTALPTDLCCCPGNTILTVRDPLTLGFSFFSKVTVKETAF